MFLLSLLSFKKWEFHTPILSQIFAIPSTSTPISFATQSSPTKSYVAESPVTLPSHPFSLWLSLLCFSLILVFFFFFIKSRIFLFVFSWDLQNFYASLHGGAVAAIAEMVSIACARTVVAEDNGIFLGDMSISYLSAAPIHVSFLGSLFGCSVCASFNSFLVLSTSTN